MPTSAENAAAPDDPACEVSVITPTYREAENLTALIPAVHAALAGAGITHEIIVVDDDSRDGTPETMARLSDVAPARLLTRVGERGLASAVVHGFDQACGRILVCMDADGSHPPPALPALVAPLRAGEAEFTLGSRYVTGGSVDDGWSLFRRANSSFASVLARPLVSVRDPMSGFFAITRPCLERARRVNAIGYKIGLELLVKCGPRGVIEVPIDFQDRAAGESKLRLRTQLQYLSQLGSLYAHRLLRRGPRSSSSAGPAA